MKKTKIAKRGPLNVKFNNGLSAALWYDHCLSRSWIIQLFDTNGMQIGPGYDETAEYWHDRGDAIESLMQLAERNGGLA